MNNETTIIEINGIKMEVDLRHATVVHDNIRVGTKVKLLEKSDYSAPKVYPGVVVGFENFQSLPTIIVGYIDTAVYGGEAGIKMAYINTSEAAAKKWELVPSQDDDLPIQKASVLERLDRDIRRKQDEIEDLERHRAFFLAHFGAYFGENAEVPA